MLSALATVTPKPKPPFAMKPFILNLTPIPFSYLTTPSRLNSPLVQIVTVASAGAITYSLFTRKWYPSTHATNRRLLSTTARSSSNNTPPIEDAPIAAPAPSSSAGTIDSFVTTFSETVGIGGNQVATGGLTLAVVGAVIAGARVLADYVWDFVKVQMIVSAEFDSRDESYSWILNFLSEHPMSKRTTRFSVSTTLAVPGQMAYLTMPPEDRERDEDLEGGGVALPKVYFLPAP
ncbi:hypothetical protein HK102_007324, partial [Quaeritorhiza haematococci]